MKVVEKFISINGEGRRAGECGLKAQQTDKTKSNF